MRKSNNCYKFQKKTYSEVSIVLFLQKIQVLLFFHLDILENDCKCQSNKLLYHHIIEEYLYICFSRVDIPKILTITYKLSLGSELVECRYDQFIMIEIRSVKEQNCIVMN